jgi:hypothetical protein
MIAPSGGLLGAAAGAAAAWSSAETMGLMATPVRSTGLLAPTCAVFGVDDDPEFTELSAIAIEPIEPIASTAMAALNKPFRSILELLPL